jgi:heme exporter protein B
MKIIALIRKEWLLEWRQRYALGGILLYVLSTVYLVYISAINISGPLWNVLLWLVVVFAAINAVAKSFTQENSYRQLYYYTLTDPVSVFIAKVIYNTLLLLAITILTSMAFAFLAGWPVQKPGLFALILVLASLGFAITLTFISGIAAKAANSATLMAILGFPVLIPTITTIIRLSTSALGMMAGTDQWREVMILLAIDLLLGALGIILFPYLWRD